MSEHTSQSREQMRQLRAARAGRYRQNDAGRYVIDGEARPDRKVREKLIRDRWLTWQFGGPRHRTVGLAITEAGAVALVVLDAGLPEETP